MIGKSKTAGTCNHRMNSDIAGNSLGLNKKRMKGLFDVGKVSFVIRKKKVLVGIHNRNLYGCGTYIYTQ